MKPKLTLWKSTMIIMFVRELIKIYLRWNLFKTDIFILHDMYDHWWGHKKYFLFLTVMMKYVFLQKICYTITDTTALC